MYAVSKERRERADLLLALAIAVFLLLLNVAINYSRRLQVFFAELYNFPVTDFLINGVFLWLAVLLLLAFRRWRTAVAGRMEMEDIVSSISPDVMLVVTPGREIVMCSASVRRVFGYSQDQVLRRRTDLLYFDRRTSSERPHEIYDALERDGFHIGSATGRRRSGETFPLEIISGELGGRAGAVLLLRDITERMRAEQQRRQLEARVQRQQKLESLGIMAGGVAHDFNNLLTVIHGNVEILRKYAECDEAGRQSLESVVSAGERAAGLCRQMLAYAGKGEFTIQPLQLSEVARRTCRLVETSFGKDIRLECRVDETLPEIEGDIVQVQQVVMNLLINASEAVGAGKGTIAVKTGLRDVDEAYLDGVSLEQRSATGRCAFLEVSDTGCGMDEKTKNRIFDPFFTTKAEGRGLGLATVLGIVRGLGGTLRVDSEPGKGATFTILFPLRDRAATRQAASG